MDAFRRDVRGRPGGSQRWAARIIVPAAIAAAAVLPAVAAGQTVVGRVVEEGTAGPVANAFVRLLDEQGAQRGGGLADSLGRYVLRAPSPGRYTVHAEQIGYGSVGSATLDLSSGQTVEQTLRLPVRAVALDAIAAGARSRCRVRPESGPETQRLWDEARKALNVAAWSTGSAGVYFETATFRRVLDRRGRPLSRTATDTATGYGPRPFVTPSAQNLAERGYIQTGATTESYVFYAPDADVLLSDEFLSTHCFWVQKAREERHAGLIGLAFEPVRTGLQADIAGVLWLDAATAELRLLEYQYTSVPWGLSDRVAGGWVEFRRIPEGNWIIQRWSIRIPRVDLAPQLRGLTAGKPRYQHIGFEEAGGDVRSLRTAVGLPVAEVRTGTVAGEVFDSTLMAPLAGVRVVLGGTGFETRTSLAGEYRLENIPAGTYELVFEHPRLSVLRIAAPLMNVQSQPGTLTRADFAVPSLPTLLADSCSARGAAGGVLAGHVREATTDAPVGAVTVAAWWHAEGAAAGARAEARTGADGRYLLCGVPSDRAIRLEASVHAWGRASTEVRLDGRPQLQVDIPLALTAPGHISGTVVDAETGAPVSGATVQLAETDRRAVSDSAGRFVLRTLAPGRHALTVQHIGYGDLAHHLDVASGARMELRVELASQAIRLRPLEVAAEPELPLRLLRVKERAQERAKLGLGRIIWREEFVKRSPRRLTDVLRDLPGIELVAHPNPIFVGHYLLRNERRRTLPRGVGSPPCRVQVWVDGHRATAPDNVSEYDEEPIDLVVPIESIAVVEVYTGAAQPPPEFGGTDFGCGAIVVWTR